MVLRSLSNPVDGFCDTLHPSQQLAAAALLSALQNNKPIGNLVHAFIYALFSMVPDHTDEEKFRCPVLRAIVLDSLDKHGSFKQPKLITKVTASTIWTIRATVFHDICVELDNSASATRLDE